MNESNSTEQIEARKMTVRKNNDSNTPVTRSKRTKKMNETHSIEFEKTPARRKAVREVNNGSNKNAPNSQSKRTNASERVSPIQLQMPSVFYVSKFRRVSFERKQKRTLQNPKKKSQQVGTFDSDSEDEDDTTHPNQILTLVTRNGPVIEKLQEMFDKCLKNELPMNSNSLECIMLCGRIRDTILYPCKHSLVCRQCWCLYKTYEGAMQEIRAEDFDDDDDNLTKPRCPYCRKPDDASDDIYR